MKIQFRFLFCALLLICAINSEAQNNNRLEMDSIVEINVLDYPFMKDIANFIKQTDHDKLAAQYKPHGFEPLYDFSIDFGNYKRNAVRTLQKNGTYSIAVSLHIGGGKTNFFEVEGVKFYTTDNLVPYFDSCKRYIQIENRPQINMNYWLYYFWFFEVKNGKVIDAIYFYEPVDDGFDEYDVYDLIHKKYIPYKVWKASLKKIREN